MKRQWQRLSERLDGLSLRERLLAFGTVLVLLGVAWLEFGYDPMAARLERLQGRAEQAQRQVQALNQQAQAIVQRVQQDPNRALEARRRQLQQESAALEQQLAERTRGFVRPAQMAPLLRDLLIAQRGLRLLSLESQQPEPVQLEGEEALPLPVYRHGMVIEWEGDYLSTLRYLQALEALPWQLGWDLLEYEVTDHPRARVRLRVHTVSLQEGWIGV